MDRQVLKDNLDFYEKIIKVTTINDKIVHELTGAMVSLHALTTFNISKAEFDTRNKNVIFKVNGEEVCISGYWDDIFRLVYLEYLCELYLKDNKGLRIIQNYTEYTHSSLWDLEDALYSYNDLRKNYVSGSEDVNFINHHICSLQRRLSNIQELLNELDKENYE